MNLTDDQIRSLRGNLERGLPCTNSIALSLVEEVQRARRFYPLLDRLEAMVSGLSGKDAMESLMSLAAKAEAGKGLYEALSNHAGDGLRHSCDRFTPLDDDALARWEAVENGRPAEPCDCICHSLASWLWMSHREDCCPHPGVRRRFSEVTDA